jgi:hypothetical protein
MVVASGSKFRPTTLNADAMRKSVKELIDLQRDLILIEE